MPQDHDNPNELSLEFLEGLFEEYLRDPQNVTPDWREYFSKLSNGHGMRVRTSLQPHSIFNPVCTAEFGADEKLAQHLIDLLVRNYRVGGHVYAQLNPLGTRRAMPPELAPDFYGFKERDLDRVFQSETKHGEESHTLRAIIERMQNTYCRSIGVQFMHIDDRQTREWLQQRMESTQNRLQLSRDEQVRIFTRLADAAVLEQFIQKRFIGAKSFSLEGAESLIPMLDLAIEKAGAQGVQEIVVAMAHRGRLNVLANILGKKPSQIFREFSDVEHDESLGFGDVKYHLGYSTDWTTASGGKVHLSLCFNPSHLEFINPVALGRMRAKQDRVNDLERKRGMVLQLHGDAAFMGEGIIQETLNLSKLEAYTVGGSIHIIINNQIGFTTGPAEGRSSIYSSDVAGMLQAPIFHVNGEDPEAVAQVIQLAMDFREKFQSDVVIDMYCCRRRGHNEGDKPSFTQPLLYKSIQKRKPVSDSYLQHLLTLGGMRKSGARTSFTATISISVLQSEEAKDSSFR